MRKNARFVPPHAHSTLTLADGSIHPCFIIDCSVTGVACVGRVVRQLPNGIAVKFVEQQTVRDLDRMVSRAVPAAAKADIDRPEPAEVLRTATG